MKWQRKRERKRKKERKGIVRKEKRFGGLKWSVFQPLNCPAQVRISARGLPAMLSEGQQINHTVLSAVQYK